MLDGFSFWEFLQIYFAFVKKTFSGIGVANV